MEIAIVTATFNRSKLLQRLIKSLDLQTIMNFTWIVVDDGSEDNTEQLISTLNKKYKIMYIKQENGGKAKALNNAFRLYKEFDLFVIVDSDDQLLPNAIENIKNKSNEYYHNLNVGALYFRYKFQNGELLTRPNSNDTEELVLSRMEHDAKFKKVDGCVAYYSRAIEKYKYPEVHNENYMGPVVIQLMMSKEYKIVFTQEVVGIAEYQEDGLSHSGRKLRIKNPLSMMIYCHYMQEDEFDKLTKIKYGIMINAYKFIGNATIKNFIKSIPGYLKIPKKYYLLGTILGKYWLEKYQISKKD